jgi:hypothetical protein
MRLRLKRPEDDLVHRAVYVHTHIGQVKHYSLCWLRLSSRLSRPGWDVSRRCCAGRNAATEPERAFCVFMLAFAESLSERFVSSQPTPSRPHLHSPHQPAHSYTLTLTFGHLHAFKPALAHSLPQSHSLGLAEGSRLRRTLAPTQRSIKTSTSGSRPDLLAGVV